MSSMGIYYFSKGNQSCGALDITTKIFFAVKTFVELLNIARMYFGRNESFNVVRIKVFVFLDKVH